MAIELGSERGGISPVEGQEESEQSERVVGTMATR